jgi:hypothetical protein
MAPDEGHESLLVSFAQAFEQLSVGISAHGRQLVISPL